MNRRLKDYLRFSRIERRGIYTLLVLILLIILAKENLMHFNPRPVELSYQDDDSLITLLERIEVKKKVRSLERKRKLPTKVEKEEHLFFFNPNNLSLEKWQALGLSQKQAKTIKNYEEKGGIFKEKADVKKMYVISDELYMQLLPYIQLPDSIPKSEKITELKADKLSSKAPLVIDINYADSAELIKLYGIGPYLASSIVKHREKLGGYHSVHQLLDIWRISDTLIDRLDTQLQISPIPLIKLNINRLSANELKKHPYIRWNVANSIEQMRKQYGLYKNIEEIRRSALINDSLYKRIKPYIEV